MPTRRALPLVAAALALALAATRGRGEDGPPRGEAAAVASPVCAALKVMDGKGRVRAIGTRAAGITALVFLGTECPISQKYLPDLDALAPRLSQEGASFYGVVSDPTVTRAAALELAKTYSIRFPVIFDASGELATRLRPTHVPEAFVIGREGEVLYRGRIDDAWRDLGKPNARVTSKDFEEATLAALSGKKIETPRTTPIGCVFESWPQDALPKKVTYARDIAPIVQAHCASCHRPGAVAPFPLLTYQDVSKRARTIAQVTESRYMPPWHAEPGALRFLDERRLSAREIALLAAFRDQGAPEGDAADLPAPVELSTGWMLGEPDLVLKMPRAFEVAASGSDIFRAFVLKTELQEDKYLVGVEFHPGAPTVVHHCQTALDTSGEARKMEQRAGGFGYFAFGGLGFVPCGSVGGWLPGVTPRFLPEGTARRLPKGADIVLQFHYHPSGKVEADQTSVGLYFAKKPPDRLIHDIFMENLDVEVPPWQAHYERKIDLELPADVELVGITPHMHYVGREMKATATPPGGASFPLVWIKDWDFRWQDQYKYEEPVFLPRRTRVRVDAWYDNTAGNPRNPNSPPKWIYRGDRTTDEMCMCRLEVALPRPTTPEGEAEQAKLVNEIRRRAENPGR